MEQAIVMKAGVFNVENDEALTRFLASKKDSTASTYRTTFEQHFLPFLATYDFQGRHFINFKELIDAFSLDFALPVAQKQLLDQAVLSDYVIYLRNKGLAPKSINLAIGAVQSAAKFWRVTITTKDINLPDPTALTESYDWKPQKIGEFNALLKHPIYRAFDAFTYQSGLGCNEVLSRKYRDIKEDFEKGEIPCFKVVREKTGVHHHTCIAEEAMQLLRAYFDDEFGENGTPQPDDFIFPMQRRPIDEIYADRARKMIGDWPHSNPCGVHSKRKAFRNAMVGVGGCPSEYAEYFMGHELGDIAKTYSTRGVDGWRDIYKKYKAALKFPILTYKEVAKTLNL